MRELDAINLTLEALGESRVMDISTSNPSAGLRDAGLQREVTPTTDGLIKVPRRGTSWL